MRDHADEQMKKAKRGYICPSCGNGSGQDGTGITEDPHNARRFKCFKCGYYGDIVDYIAVESGIDPADSAAAFAKAREVFGITIDEKTPHRAPQTPKTAPAEPVKEKQSEADHKEIEAFLESVRITELASEIGGYSNEEGIEYLQRRGISAATAERLNIGYTREYKREENGKTVTASEVLIIPYSNELDKTLYYTKRRIKASEDEGARYYNYTGGTWGIFNEAAIYEGSSAPLYIFEGAIDAASAIEAAEVRAIAIQGVANGDKLISYLNAFQRYKSGTNIIIVRDADEAGEGFYRLLNGLIEAGYRATITTPKAPYKDLNKMLQAEGAESVRKFLEQAKDTANEEGLKRIRANSAGQLLQRLSNYIADTKEKPPIKTGYACFDQTIGGGLYPRLYVIGAASSLGKTTFALQAADYIAASGAPVLFFSLEMSAEEIIGRSISRRTFQKATEAGNYSLAKTEIGITAGHRYKGYSEAELATIREAWKDYGAEEGDSLIIYDGNRTIDEIEEKIKEFISFTGRTPAVFIDYLQFLQPAESVRKAQIREQTDYNISKLAQIKREYKTPLIVISAFNRTSYTGTADNSSFKESGLIEYTADCTITLEIDRKSASESESDYQAKEKAKRDIISGMRADTRSIKLTFQKNRSGRTGSTIYFKYLPMFNLFEEDPEKSEY